MYVLILLFTSLCYGSDCGCGKLNRESSGSASNLLSDDESCPANKPRSDGGHSNMALIKGGVFEIGTDEPVFVADGETPARPVELDDFYIDLYEVSNQDFKTFVELTGYVTEAEKFGNSFVFETILDDETKAEVTQVVAAAPWWANIPNATWDKPEGPKSSLTGWFFIYNNHIFVTN